MKLNKKGKWLVTLLFLIVPILFIFNSLETQPTKKVPMPTKLNDLVEAKSKQLVNEAARKGIRVVITDDFRSAKDQNALYAQGRSSDGNVVTNARGGESYHNYGLAIDFALAAPGGEQLIWDMDYDGNGNSKSDWKEVVEIAKNLGFEWGGDWAKFKDYPHLQMSFGLTINDLQNGVRPSKNGVPTNLAMKDKIVKFFKEISNI
ncbi:M15 family metallopeptidase [Neobacillus terrae]|uniref:M15 family metallopeptidase n=1 Tax=Neobacillus terrae TaxID=3034837 RepID=UPI00140CB367|nr:M15 family metallopeptidase [Neobacillus terrae]NHM32238.1 M15 family metallopeptidase [Neobacillus terrae]